MRYEQPPIDHYIGVAELVVGFVVCLLCIGFIISIFL